MEFADCPCSGKTLARLVQPAIMTVLADAPIHGYLISQRVAELKMFDSAPPDPTGIYRVLKSMELRGLVASTWDLSNSGPARRQYELTDAGRSCLSQWVCTLRSYQAAIHELLKATQLASGEN